MKRRRSAFRSPHLPYPSSPGGRGGKKEKAYGSSSFSPLSLWERGAGGVRASRTTGAGFTVFCLAFFLAAPALPQPAPVSVRLAPTGPTVGDHVQAAITLRMKTADLAGEPTFPAWGRTWGEAEIVEKREPAKMSEQGGITVYEQRLVLAAFRPGEVPLPPVAIAVPMKAGTLQVRTPAGLALAVKSVIPGEEKDPKPKPAAALRQLPLGERFWWTLAILSAASLLAAWLLFRRRRTAGPAAVEVPSLPPFDELTAELDRLAAEPSMIALHTRLSLALRRYLGRRLPFSAVESTTSEIQRQLLARRMPGPLVRQAVELLRGCDLVKFARQEVNEARARERMEAALRIAREARVALGASRAGGVGGRGMTQTFPHLADPAWLLLLLLLPVLVWIASSPASPIVAGRPHLQPAAGRRPDARRLAAAPPLLRPPAGARLPGAGTLPAAARLCLGGEPHRGDRHPARARHLGQHGSRGLPAQEPPDGRQAGGQGVRRRPARRPHRHDRLLRRRHDARAADHGPPDARPADRFGRAQHAAGRYRHRGRPRQRRRAAQGQPGQDEGHRARHRRREQRRRHRSDLRRIAVQGTGAQGVRRRRRLRRARDGSSAGAGSGHRPHGDAAVPDERAGGRAADAADRRAARAGTSTRPPTARACSRSSARSTAWRRRRSRSSATSAIAKPFLLSSGRASGCSSSPSPPRVSG